MDQTMSLYFYEALKNDSTLDFLFEYSPTFSMMQYRKIKEPQDPGDYAYALSSVKRTYKLAQRIAAAIPLNELPACEICLEAQVPETVRAWTVDQNCRMVIKNSKSLVTGIIDFAVPQGTPLKSLQLVTRVANDIINIRHSCKNYINLTTYSWATWLNILSLVLPTNSTIL